MFTSSTTTSDYSHIINPLVMDRATTKWKYTNIEIAPNCPRCASSNTKFCYYNNYSLSQPRYFCKGCRRYWTKGGSLRNVPVGGGCRKSRRSRAAARQPGGIPSYADPLAGSAEASSGGACIDMAAVFAKYANQHVENVVNEETSSFSPGATSSGSSDNLQANTFDVDSQLKDVTAFDLMGVGDDQMQQVIMPQLGTCQDVTGQQYVYQENSHGFGLQQQGVVLCDDILWAEGTTLPNLGYQQSMVQVDDCGLFTPDNYDQLRISANLVSENWGSFDLSAAYDFYSTP